MFDVALMIRLCFDVEIGSQWKSQNYLQSYGSAFKFASKFATKENSAVGKLYKIPCDDRGSKLLLICAYNKHNVCLIINVSKAFTHISIFIFQIYCNQY